jgi:DnaD/phage-associated family protein
MSVTTKNLSPFSLSVDPSMLRAGSDGDRGGEVPRFAGFPAGARATAVPSVFFSELLPQIESPAELRVTLYVIYTLGRRKGYPRFVTERELRSEQALIAALSWGDDAAALELLREGLSLAVERGSLLTLEVEHSGRLETLLFLNSPSSRRAVAQISAGELPIGRPLGPEAAPPASRRDNIFLLYEANIGALTPLVAEALKEAEQLYPQEWLEDAFREAALQNKRSWRYVAAILQRWATEGRRREAPGRDPDAGNSARAQFLRRYRGLGG